MYVRINQTKSYNSVVRDGWVPTETPCEFEGPNNICVKLGSNCPTSVFCLFLILALAYAWLPIRATPPSEYKA